MMNTNNNRIYNKLYYDNHCYETEEITITIYPNQIILTEYTYEHAPGGSYGLTHVLDSKNAKKFIAKMKLAGRDLSETVKKKFSGPDGAEKFKEYCKRKGISYISHRG